MKQAIPLTGRRTLSQASRHTGFPVSELRRHVKHGSLVARQYGRRLFLHEEDLLAWAVGR